jgi:predicted PurR-regulated permease PerM
METKYTRYLFITILVIIVLLSFLIIKPLINVFLWSLILSYMFYPAYVVIKKGVRIPTLASLLTVLLMVLVVTVPLFFIIKGLSEEAFAFYAAAKQELATGSISISTLTKNCESDFSPLCNTARFVDKTMSTYFPTELMKQVGTKFLAGALNTMIDFILTLPSLLLNIALSFFITFFLIRDWEKFRKSIYEFAAFKTADMDKILHRINSTTHSIIFAAVMVAIIQGVLGMIGFYVVGLPSPILLGAVMGFFALIPFVGTAVVWVPASLYLIGKGILVDSTVLLYQGVGLLLYGALIISTIDNFLRPKLAGDAAKIHPVVVIAGVIGGTKLMGFIGIFVGPVILSLLITIVTMAIEKYHHDSLAEKK